MMRRLAMMCVVALLGVGRVRGAAPAPTPEAIGATIAAGALKEDTWTLLNTTVRNPTDSPIDALVATAFDAAPNVQFAARTWVPAHARRRVMQPARLAQFPKTPRSTNSVGGTELFTLLLDPLTNPERQWSRQDGLIQTERLGLPGMKMSIEMLQHVAKVGDSTDVDLATWREAKRLTVLSHDQSEALKSAFGGNENRESAAYAVWDEREATAHPSPTDAAFRHIHDAFVRCSGVTLSTVFLAAADDPEVEAVAIAARRAARLAPSLVYLSHERMPPIAVGLEGFTHVVLASPSPGLDAAQIEALRQWLVAGGRLWVMADRVDDSFCRRLLAEDWTVQVVDRVDLQDFAFVDTRAAANDPKAREEHHLDRAVDMVRVLAPRMEVVHTVQGWPASLRQRVGMGEVLITTVGPRGWMDSETSRFGGAALRDLATDLYSRSDRPGTPNAALKAFVESEVARPTVAREPVLIVLTALTGGLVLAGLVASRRGRLEYATGAAVILSVVAALVLFALGLSKQQSVPLTVASVQIGDAEPAQQRVVATGQLAIYSPKADQGPLRATRGGLVWPDFSAQHGELIRMVWSDLDRWEWQKLNLPQGALLRASFTNVLPLDQPLHATGRYTPDGLRVTFAPGPFGKLEDVIIVGTAGRLAPAAAGPQEFLAGPRQMLGLHDFVAGSLDGVRADRARIYKSTLAGPDRRTPTNPMLMGWTTQFDLGFVLPERQQAQHREATMLSVPIDVAHVQAGETVVVPPGLISWEPLQLSGQRGPRRYTSTTIYNPMVQEWIGINSGSTVLLRFTLPPQVVPLQVTEETFTFTIDAVGRKVEVVADQGGPDDYRVLATFSNLSKATPQEVTLRGTQLLPAGADGTIMLGLRVSSVPTPESIWQLVDVGLAVKGQGLAAPGPEVIRLHPKRTSRIRPGESEDRPPVVPAPATRRSTPPKATSTEPRK